MSRGVCALLVLLLCEVSVVHADDNDSVDYRVHIMKTMEYEAAAINLILDKKVPPDNLRAHAQILAATAATALKAFEPAAVAGRSKASIWDNWPDFSRRMNELATNTSLLARTLDAANLKAAAGSVRAALTCNACHDIYRQSRPDVDTPGAATAVVDYRRDIMATLNEQSQALGMIVAASVPDENASAHLQIIALTAAAALRSFEPKVPGGEARDEVWTNWADFSKRMNEFATATALAARNAKEKGPGAGLADIDKTLSCKSCHDLYRDSSQ